MNLYVYRQNYDLWIMTDNEFVETFGIDCSYEEWAGSGATLSDVMDFTTPEDAQTWLDAEYELGNIDAEKHNELSNELRNL